MSTSVYKTCQREGIATLGRICTTIVRKSLVTVLHAHLPDVVLKLRRISAEQRKDSPLSSEKMTSTEKVSSFLSSTRFEGDVFGPVNASKSFESDVSGPVNVSALQSDSSRFWRKFTDEQDSHLLSLTKDLVENDCEGGNRLGKNAK